MTNRSKPLTQRVVTRPNEFTTITQDWVRAVNAKGDRVKQPWKPYKVSKLVVHRHIVPPYSTRPVAVPTVFSNTDLLKKRAYARAFDDLAEQLRVTKNSFGMTFGQIDKTLAQMADYTNRVRKSIKLAKRGKFSQATRELVGATLKGKQSRIIRKRNIQKIKRLESKSVRKTVADEWLGIAYGVQPIAIEMDNLRKRIESGHAYFTDTVDSYGRETFKDSKTTRYGSWSSELTCKCRIKAEFELTNPNLALADSLGLLNPALVINDAIAFSFVVNYFTGHEKWLESLTALAGVKIRRCTVSYRNDYIIEGGGTRGDVRMREYRTLKSYERSVVRNLQIPGLFDRFRFIPGMSLQRALNSAALLTTLLTKR